MLRTVVLSTGFHVPERVVANQDLTKQMETSDENGSGCGRGIVERRWAENGVGASDLAERAASRLYHGIRLGLHLGQRV